MFEIELESFFDRAFECFLNEKLFYRDFQLDKKKMAEYTDTLVSIPINTYIQYMVNHILPCRPSPQDVVQFSSLNDATCKLCSKLIEVGDEGLRFVQIGRLLLDDGKERKKGALTKYGENHAKTALEFGLVQNSYDYIYLSCLGKVFNDYDSNKQRQLLKRLILRNRFFQKLAIQSQKGPVNLNIEMDFLSDSTIRRRRSNIRTLFYLFDHEEQQQYFSNITGLHSSNTIVEQ